jgi:hypothetical protein
MIQNAVLRMSAQSGLPQARRYTRFNMRNVDPMPAR